MKGIIMEVDGKNLVVMKKNGEFIKMKKESQNVCVGQEISIQRGKGNQKGTIRRLTALAASFLIFLGAGVGGYAYYAPKGYVNVDINPGIEMVYNRFDNVIKAEGMNEDGKKVLVTAGNLKNNDVGIAMKRILEAAEENKYIYHDEENYVNVLVSGENTEFNIEKAKNAIRNHHTETGLRFSYNVETESIESYKASKAEADDLDITPGKLSLLKKVYGEHETGEGSENRDASYKEYKDLSVKEIMQTFNRNSGNGNESGNESGNGNGNGNGNGTGITKDKGKEEHGNESGTIKDSNDETEYVKNSNYENSEGKGSDGGNGDVNDLKDETGITKDSNDESGGEKNGKPGKGNSSGNGNK